MILSNPVLLVNLISSDMAGGPQGGGARGAGRGGRCLHNTLSLRRAGGGGGDS